MKTYLTRRQFLKITGAGLAIAVVTTPAGIRLLSAAELAEEGPSFRPSVWLEVRPDDTVIVTVNKSEMGQGVYTSLPMIVADELDADWQKVRMAVAPAGDAYKDPIWGSQSTGGSSSIRHMFDALSKAGAAARQMLVTAAAGRWQVPASECTYELGTVRHLKSGQSLTYGQLTAEAAKLAVPQNPELKKETQYRYIGKGLARLDIHDKVSGKAKFGIDSTVPGMLYATIARPPAYGAEASSYQRQAAGKVPGVKAIVPCRGGIGVCADSLAAAWKGRDALKPVWTRGSDPRMNTASLEKDFLSRLDRQGIVARNDGDAAGTIDRATRKFEAIFQQPFLAHATMEPMNCTADVRPNSCEIWVPTQNQTGTQQKAMKITGLKAEQITVHTTYLGGGFGRRFERDFVEEALLLSKATGRPVKLVWTREEDTKNDFYRPMNATRIRAALDHHDKITAWSHTIVCPSIFARVFPKRMKNGIDSAAVEGVENMEYAIPNLHVEYVRYDTPVPVGFWRSVGSSHNAFTVESFVDELAHAAKKDPLEFRLTMLKDHPRAAKVLQVAAEKAGWGKPLAEGHSHVIAYHPCFGSYVAEVAEVAVDRKSGSIMVHKVTCAVDCGSVVNPAILKAQMMSGIIMGMSAALKEKIEVAEGGIKSANFDDYELLRMSEAPEVDVHIVKSGAALGGIGEPGVPPLIPAIGNAVFAATGTRLRQLPMWPALVLGAMGRG
ncbi:MAG: xanthine dehydrogenase family protein molybdopterin-binding subunit [Deltaproteobacteria bacterium]